MATRKFRKTRPRKRTVRRRKYSTAGKILPPLDVRSNKHLKEFEKRIKSGDLTIILVWAPWCPHCHTMMPHFDAAAKSPTRSIQAVKVQDTMLPAVNQVLTGNINKKAKPLNVEGYPSIIVVDKNGNKVTDVEPIRNTASMTKLMAKAGPLASQAGLNTPNEDPVQIENSIENTLKTVKPVSNNINIPAKPASIKAASMNSGLMANLGIEDEGLVSGSPQNSMTVFPQNSPKNINLGEGELKGSLAANSLKNKSIKLNSIPSNELGQIGQNSLKPKKQIPTASIAPSPLNTFDSENEPTITPPSADLKRLSQEAEEITSLEAPLSPPTGNNDLEPESISNSLTPEQKLSGGGRKGGSMMSAMARTTYTLAPAAALLATAAMVMKGKQRKTHRKSKKTRKTTRRR